MGGGGGVSMADDDSGGGKGVSGKRGRKGAKNTLITNMHNPIIRKQIRPHNLGAIHKNGPVLLHPQVEFIPLGGGLGPVGHHGRVQHFPLDDVVAHQGGEF